jgi:histidinol-phosphate aminotransferase
MEQATAKAKMVFLASPNNPTGNALPIDQLKALLKHRALVVVDEAYAEFAGESAVDLAAEHDNLVVIRTFSKWAGLAGLRIGYAVMARSLVDLIWRIKVPYNLSVAAEQAVLVTLEDREALMRNVALIVAERQRMMERLSAIPWLRPYPSTANFVLCDITGIPAREVRDELRSGGILIRHFDSPMLRNCIRVSVGKPADTDRLIAALKQIGARVRG